MTDGSPTSSEHDELLLGSLIEEFTARRRAGERPDVEEYVARHPARAASIREILATVEALEENDLASWSGPRAGAPLTRIGEYRIEREIGRGGMGVVFLALDERLGRRVALKLLPVQATLDPRFLERFRREARAAAGLQHPHIVPVFGVGEHEGLHYYAMQYVEGHALDEVTRALRAEAPNGAPSGGTSSVESLARALRSREMGDDSGSDPVGTVELEPTGLPSAPRPPGERSQYHRNVARLGFQVARALGFAHGHGILHRDIKPANLLLDARGHVWITDFGLCTTSEESDLTASRDLVGTLRYMAPEQMEGRADVRSDVYGLGITLYELLTLRPAFAGSDRASLMKRIVEREPLRPRRIDPGIPSDLEAIVLKAIAKLPEERYGTAQGLADDLRAFLEGRPIAARPPSALHLVRLAIRRNRVLATTLAGASLALLTASVLYLIGLREAWNEQARQLYLADVAAAAASLESDPAAARRSLEHAPREWRAWEWEHLGARADQSLARLAALGELTRDLAMTPDGARLVVAAGESVTLIDVDGEQPPRSGERLNSAVTALDVSPDGARAAVLCESEVVVVDLAEAPRTLALRRLSAEPTAVCFDRSGERVWVGSITGSIHCFDAALERELAVLRGHSGRVVALLAAPDGSLISSGIDRSVRVWEPDSGRARTLSGHEGAVMALDLDPHGELLASLDAGGVVRLWALGSGEALRVLRGPPGGTALSFSPDGRLLVSTAEDRSLSVWEVGDALGARGADPFAVEPPPIRISDPPWERVARTLLGHGAPPCGLAFAWDGRLFSAGVDGSVLEWNADAGGGSLVLTGHVSDTWGLAFDATGTRLVSTSRDTTVRVWSAETGRLLRLVHSGSVPYGACFSPDGREIAVVCRDGALRLWEVASGTPLAELVCPERAGQEQIQGRVGYDPSGRRLFAAEHLAGFDLWERTAGGWRLERHVPAAGAFAIEVAPDGLHVAVGCVDGRLVLIDARDGTTRFETKAHAGRIRSLAFRADGRALATAGPDGLAKVWSVPRGELLAAIAVRDASVPESDIEGIAWSPDGTRLACVQSGSGVVLLDPERGEHVATLQGPGRGYNQVVFDPTGCRIASGSWGGDIRVWDTVTASERSARLRAAPPGSSSPSRERADREAFALLLERARRLLRSGALDAAALYEARWIGRGILQEHAADPRASIVYGEALYRAGELEDGLARLEAAVDAGEQLGRPSFDAFALLASAAARAGRVEKARAALARARELVEDAPSYGALGPRELLAEAERALREAREAAGR